MSKKSTYKTQVIEMRSQGKSYKEIKEVLGCSYSTIHYLSSDKERLKHSDRKKTLKIKGSVYKDRKGSIKRNRQIVQAYLNTHPCVDCGISDVRVLEFDHVRDTKLGNISHAVRDAWKVEKLIQEIDKCEVRCANCHRIVTKERKSTV